jgi:hypothetical protein
MYFQTLADLIASACCGGLEHFWGLYLRFLCLKMKNLR